MKSQRVRTKSEPNVFAQLYKYELTKAFLTFMTHKCVDSAHTLCKLTQKTQKMNMHGNVMLCLNESENIEKMWSCGHVLMWFS